MKITNFEKKTIVRLYTNYILKSYNEYMVENNDSWAVDINLELQSLG